ncbi:NAD(P)H-dependent oxidoreductase [bacterium]|nr:NAD(P)H-dependent oxidoreductase [bacterium]
MKTLIVYAHPNEESLNFELLKNVEKTLENSKKEFKTIDLHKDGFNPVLIFNKDKKRRDLHLDSETESYRELVKWADSIIFIYPLWWNDMPAILKGFIDRVFVLNFAYESSSKFPKGLLTTKKSLIINTMDSPEFYSKYILLDDHFRNFKRSILKFCGFKKVERFSFYSVKDSSKESIEKNISKMIKTVKDFVK